MQDEKLKLIELIYSAALDDSLWTSVLDALSTTTGGMGAVLFSLNGSGPAVTTTPSLEEANRVYERDEWWRRDTLRNRAAQLGLRSGLVTSRETLTEEIWRNDPFLNEFWKDQKIGAMASFAGAPQEDLAFTFAIQREKRLGFFKDEELALLKTAGPHLAKALQISARLGCLEAAAADAASIIERVNAPCMIVSAGGKVSAINQRALGYIGGAVKVRAGALQLATPDLQRELERLLRLGAGGTFTCNALRAQDADGATLLLQVFTLPRRERSPLLSSFVGVGASLVIITPVNEAGRLPPALALQCLGLTNMEVSVATAIGEGQSPAEVAEQFQPSVHTVRTHLKTVYSKLGVHRQSELARLIAQLNIIA